MNDTHVFREHAYPTIVVSDLSKAFGRMAALSQLSFTIQPGVVGLLGPNGAGKTTLLRILATVLRPDRGTLELLGHDPASSTGRLAIRRSLGYMPQDPGYYASFSVYEFVDYMAVLKEITSPAIRRHEVERALGAVELRSKARVKIRSLSGGMKRRVALAQALLGDPQLLILDEPTVGLDPEQRLHYRELISDIGESRTIILSTHQTEDVSALCQRVIVLHHGSILLSGTPALLTEQARDRAWMSSEKSGSARVAWRTSEGAYRNVGDPPRGAQLVAPTLEDGYLILVGREAREERQ